MTPRTETRELTEHERLSLVKDKSQAIGDFVEWLAEKGIRLARYHSHSEGCYPDAFVVMIIGAVIVALRNC